MREIIFTDGGKGGVGKSMAAISIADFFMRSEKSVACIDSDTTNPDFSRLFKGLEPDGIFTSNYDLNQTEDWMFFLESLESLPKELTKIVVSLPAGIDMTNHLETACSVFEALDISITTVFVINRQMDSISLLEKSGEHGLIAHSNKKVCLLNGLFGSEDQFDRFNESQTKEHFCSSGGLVGFLPELFYRSVDLCLVDAIAPFSIALKQQMPIVYRTQISHWLKQTDALYQQCLN